MFAAAHYLKQIGCVLYSGGGIRSAALAENIRNKRRASIAVRGVHQKRRHAARLKKYRPRNMIYFLSWRVSCFSLDSASYGGTHIRRLVPASAVICRRPMAVGDMFARRMRSKWASPNIGVRKSGGAYYARGYLLRYMTRLPTAAAVTGTWRKRIVARRRRNVINMPVWLSWKMPRLREVCAAEARKMRRIGFPVQQTPGAARLSRKIA
jgi:hypothetical protein